jgi:hypothetical protein
MRMQGSVPKCANRNHQFGFAGFSKLFKVTKPTQAGRQSWDLAWLNIVAAIRRGKTT